MKRKIVSILLALIMTSFVVSPAVSTADTSIDAPFSATPKDMTPAVGDYSPGLGDRMDSISYTIDFGIGVGASIPSGGYSVITTYDQALAIQRKVANISNGAHQVAYAIGQDALRWGTAPYLIEDTNAPMGDGTPGSGYRKYKEYVENSFANNADVAQILEPLLAGSMRDDYASPEEMIPESCYTHDENGNEKVGWTANGREWLLLSLYNLYESGYAQKAWQRMKDNWDFRTHIYYDAMIPVAEGLYNNPNLTTAYGGVITNTEMEWDAVQRETAYSWETFAISSGQEYIHPKYKGLSCYFTVPYGTVTDLDYMNTWGNSVMISSRGDDIMNLVWGSEVTTADNAFGYDGRNQPGASFVTRLMEHNLQYLYMMERTPVSFVNNSKIHQVTFSGGLVSTYDKKTGNYTLVENGDFVIADGNDRFIPQVGAGCKIYAYARSGKTRTWKLPDAWAGITEIDRYTLSVSSVPVKKDTLTVKDGCVTMRMNPGTPFLLVPKGDSPTPVTANFNELASGEALGTYQGLDFAVSGNPSFKVYGPNARGGFGTPSVYADTAEASVVASIKMAPGAILHSLKVGNRGGAGRVVLHSSNPLNEDVMITLPATDQVYKFNTGWAFGEIGEVTVLIENDEGASNVLFDAIMYSETSAAANCADGSHEYEHRHIDAICGEDGRDSDVCRYCGDEVNVTVIPAIAGSHAFADEEALLTATEYNPGRLAKVCPKCGYSIETDVPATGDKKPTSASSGHTHTNELIASHDATYFHGSYDEYECSSCHTRTVVETGGVIEGKALVRLAALEPTCTAAGHIGYWYDREGNRFSDAAGKAPLTSPTAIAALGHDLAHHPAVQTTGDSEGFIEYWSCRRCNKSFADANAQTQISPAKSDDVREAERAIAAIGEVKYREETPFSASGVVGTFTGSNGYSLFTVGNSGSKLNADYAVEMTVRFRDVDYETQIGGESGAFFGMGCENFTVGYDFATEKWGVSPTSGLFGSYAFHPSEVGTACVLDDGYFHTVRIECTTAAIRVFVDGSCVLSATSLTRENGRYCIFYPRLCNVDFASYAFMYAGEWVDDHLTGRAIANASTWTDRGEAYGRTARTFSGFTFADSLQAIEYAESLFAELSEDEKLLVPNCAALASARTTYDLLASGHVFAAGDLNRDGAVNARDVIALMRYVVGWRDGTLSDEIADITGDGRVNARDVIALMKAIVSGN